LSGIAGRHPLKAHISERRAWVQLDSWQFRKVLDSFNHSLAIRQKASLRSDDTHTAKAILWIRQGMAMSNHFLGNKQIATDAYRSLLADIPDAAEVRSQRERRMSERGPNVYERLADCHLFGPQPSNQDYQTAAELLDEGIRQAKFLGLTRNNKAPYIVRLYFKLRIVEALDDSRQQDSRLQDPHLDELVHQLVESGNDEVFAAAKMVADAVVNLRSSVPEQRDRGAGALLQMIEDTQSEEREITRNNIEFHLLAIEQLCQSHLLSQIQLETVAQQLITLANVADPRGQEGVVEYLRRYLVSLEDELQRSLADRPNEHLSRELAVIQQRLQ
jgi:hypothetical protein